MNYTRPELAERLAADYTLGTMPRRARQRFDQLMAVDASLAAQVAAWSERLMPLDDLTAGETPPRRVWRAIERRVAGAAAAPAPARLRTGALALWRGITAMAISACAALVVYIALYSPPLPKIVAVLADRTGLPGWIAFAGHSGQVGVSAIGTVGGDRDHAFELWGISGGAPRALGVLPADPDRPLWLRAALLPATGGALAVSVEPPGGSPSGQPTGPVIYQGKVLQPPP